MIKTTGALTLVIILGLAFISCSTKPTEVIKEYESAFNSHDVNKLTSLFTDNAVIELSLLNHLKNSQTLVIIMLLT